MGTGRLPAPLGKRFHKAVRPAHHAEIAIPLPLRIQLRVLPVADGFPGANQHRRFPQPGPVNPHAPLQQPHAGVQQHRLHPPGNPRIAQRQIHRQRFVPAVDISRPRRLVNFLPRQSLPHRRPLRTGRRNNIVDAQVAKGFQNGIAAIRPGLPCGNSHNSRPPANRQRAGFCSVQYRLEE